MARPQKTGLEYFPLDVDIDQDDKIQLIEAQFSITGFAIVIKLFMKIYKEGYYYEWTEKEQLLFSKRVNVDINLVNDVINECIKWGLFDSTLYEKYKILTSKGIQRRYLEATGRRKQVEIIKEYCLIDASKYSNIIFVNINGVNVDINTNSNKVNDNIGTQSKVKESKVINADDDLLGPDPDETPVTDMDADSIQQEPVADVSADLTQQEEFASGLRRIEQYYAQKLSRLPSINDLQAMLQVYEEGYPVDFIIKCIDLGCERYQKANGKINSFKYFVPIIEDEWVKKKVREEGEKATPGSPPTVQRKKAQPKRNRFNNFEQQSSKYSKDELEKLFRSN